MKEFLFNEEGNGIIGKNSTESKNFEKYKAIAGLFGLIKIPANCLV